MMQMRLRVPIFTKVEMLFWAKRACFASQHTNEQSDPSPKGTESGHRTNVHLWWKRFEQAPLNPGVSGN